VNIVKKSLEEPLKMIVSNAGHEGSIAIERVKAKKGAFGFNARTDQYEDLIEAGVIDPTKVARFALQNAASVAALMLTTQCMIADKPEEKGGGGMPGMPPGGGYPGMGM
jgi:chaperonin GroEL